MKIQNLPSGPLAVNTYLVWDEETNKGFIVDPGGYDKRMINAILEENVEIEYIILTHGHGDHIGGVEEYLNEYKNAKLVAAESEKPMLANPDLNMSILTLNKSVVLYPDLAVKDEETLSVGNMELKFVMTPGHTPGGMCIIIGNVVFSGDTLFQASIGRTDFPGGSFDELAKAIHEKLFILPDETQVFPGHMGPTNIGYEKGNNPFV